MAGHGRQAGEQPRGDEVSQRSGQAADAAESPQDSLTEDELRWVAAGTKPTEDEPFAPG